VDETPLAVALLAASAGLRLRGLGGALEALQRVLHAALDQAAHQALEQTAPPAWREGEVSPVADAAAAGVDGHDGDGHLVGDAQRELDVHPELPGRFVHLQHVEADGEPRGAGLQVLAGGQRPLGRGAHQPGVPPGVERARIAQQRPGGVGGGVDDIGGAGADHGATLRRASRAVKAPSCTPVGD